MATIHMAPKNTKLCIQKLWIRFWIKQTGIKHQILDPETDETCQFLDAHPETDFMDKFLNPETDIMGERNCTFLLHILKTKKRKNNLSDFRGLDIPDENGVL